MPAIGSGISADKLQSTAYGASTTTETVFLDSGGSNALVCYWLGGNVLNNRKFTVVAGGRIATESTTNFTIEMQYGTSGTVGGNTDIEASTARAVNSTSAPFHIECELVYDATAQKIQGRGWSMVNNLVDAVAAIDNEITSVDGSLDAKPNSMGFVVTGTFSGSDADNQAIVEYFELIPQ